MAESPSDFCISLADARAYLRIPAGNISDDSMIQNTFIPAINDVIRHECGQIMPKQYTEGYDGGDYAIWLRKIPILTVINVQEGWGFTNYDLDYVQVNTPGATSMFAYSIDTTETGQISRRSAGNVNIPFMHGESNIQVTYVAGRAFVPGAVKLAALELVAHWYQGSQQRSAQYQNEGFDATDMDQPTSGALGGLIGINLGVPTRVIELLKPYRHMPYIG